MEFRVLGPLEVLDDGRALALGGPKQRSLLGLLLLNANRVVSTDRLIEEVWGEAEGAVRTLQVYVSNLRKLLEPTRGSDESPALLVTRSPGYVIQLDPGQLDLLRLERLIDAGREGLGAGDAEGAATRLHGALDLWRGPLLADLADEPFVTAEAARLEHLRLDALEMCFEAELACGRHAEIAVELEVAVNAHPLRERLWAQLMVALYRAGRQSEALRACGRVRRILGEELGIQPGAELVRLEDAILLHKPELDWAPAAVMERPALAPSTLPSGVVTFLLSDVADSTRLWERDATAMAVALALHDDIIANAVGSHGGVLLKARGEGDSTFSVFTRASDAAAAALAAQQALGDQDWPTPAPMSVRMALHTGEALERDRDYYGRTVNRVARLRSIAAAGQILVSQSSAEVIRDHLPAEAALVELGDQALRDLDRPERVFALHEPGMAEAPTPTVVDVAASVARRPLPALLMSAAGASFFGRDPELERLHESWKEASAGDRTSVFLAGEPGIGKTRLAAELARVMYTEGATVLYGRCDEDLEAPYQPFIEALRSFADGVPTHELRGSLGRYASELVRLLPELGERLGLAAPTSADPDTDRYRLFEAVSAWLSTTAAVRPLLFVLDDLHWATKATLLLLRHVARSPEPAPLLLVGTYRDTELSSAHALGELLADLATLPGYHRLELGGLDDAGVAALVEEAAGHDEITPALAESLQHETAGNPLFVGEMLRHLAESGALYVRDQLQRVRAVGVPEGVRAVIDRRVQRLSEPARRVLSVAGIAGPTFSLELLEHVSSAGGPDVVLDALDEGVGARLVAEAPGSPGTYSFTHDLIRQALADNLTLSRRARLHRQIGEALEELSDAGAIVLPLSGTTMFGVSRGVVEASGADLRGLAYHFMAAAQDETAAKAVRYATLAARQALDELALDEALVLLDRGRGVLDRSRRVDSVVAADLFLVIAQASEIAGDGAGHEVAALRAADEARSARSPERLAMAAIAATDWMMHQRDDPRSEALCEEALAALGSEFPSLRARVLASLADLSSFSLRGDRRPGLAMAKEAVEIARISHDDAVLADTLRVYLIATWGSHDVDAASESAEELLTIAQRTGDSGVRLSGLVLRERIRVELGDLSRFEALLAEMENFAADRRSWDAQVDATVGRVFLELLRGRFGDAETLAASALEVSHHPQAPSLYGHQLFFIRREQGRLGEVLRAAERGVRQNPDWAVFRAALALAHAEVGALEEANEELERFASEGFAAVLPGGLWTITVSMLADVCGALRDAHRAETLYDLLVPHSGHLIVVGNFIACNGAVDRYLGLLASTCGRYEDAEAHFRSALTLEGSIPSPPLIARTQMWYGRMLLARNGRGDKSEASELLAAAKSTAQGLGMKALAEQTSELGTQVTP